MENKYSELVVKLLNLGEPDTSKNEWIDYSSMGFTPEHIPELIKMVRDDKLNMGDPESFDVWAPLHAWRALGQMKAVEAIYPLLDQLNMIDDNDDDWIDDDFPIVFSKIGSPAVEPIAEYIGNTQKPLFARICAMHCLVNIGKADPSVRGRCVEILTFNLRNHKNQDPTLNVFLIFYLKEINGSESINEIRQAYLSDSVDLDVLGDIEDVEISLGLRSKRETVRRESLFPLDIPGLFEDYPESSDDDLPFVNLNHRPGRNEPCPCGSGKKYKKCCLK